MNKTWTAKKEKTLRELWPLADFSCQMIAEKLGLTDNAVIGKARRLGLGPKPTEAKVKKPKAPRCSARLKKRAFKPLPQTQPPAHETKTLLTIAPSECRYPTHEVDGVFHFCAQPVLANKPYCAQHCETVYRQKEQSHAQPNTRANFNLRSRKAIAG
jgi:GcrA cell cycle regulator